MPRLITCAVLTTIVLLGAAPGAAAKVVKAMKVCGPDRCVRVERAAAQRYHENGGLEGPSIGRTATRRLRRLASCVWIFRYCSP